MQWKNRTVQYIIGSISEHNDGIPVVGGIRVLKVNVFMTDKVL